MQDSVKTICIAVIHSSRGILGSESSGASVYEASLGELLDQVVQEIPINVIHYVPALSRFRFTPVTQPNRIIREFRSGFWEQLLSKFPHSIAAHLVEKFGLLKSQKRLRRDGVDIVYFTSPSPIALRLVDIPYVFTVWDLGHRDLPGFPEVWSRSVWIGRDNIYSMGTGRASFVFVDSKLTGIKLEDNYGVEPWRWREIGLLPNFAIGDTVETDIQTPYLFYPALQWPHKNHVTLFEAFAVLLQEFPDLKLVLSGGRWKRRNGLANLASRLGIDESLINLGFVSRNKLRSVISGSEALVMPSLLGPTNIPPLEALEMGVPVVVSDVHDFGEDINQSLIRVPALDSSAWVAALKKVLTSDSKTVSKVFSNAAAVEAHVEAFTRIIGERKVVAEYLGSQVRRTDPPVV